MKLNKVEEPVDEVIPRFEEPQDRIKLREKLQDSQGGQFEERKSHITGAHLFGSLKQNLKKAVKDEKDTAKEIDNLDAFSLKLLNHMKDLKIEAPGTSFLNPYWKLNEDFFDAYSQIRMKIKEFDEEYIEDRKPRIKIGKSIMN